jgi:hypothetical protein
MYTLGTWPHDWCETMYPECTFFTPECQMSSLWWRCGMCSCIHARYCRVRLWSAYDLVRAEFIHSHHYLWLKSHISLQLVLIQCRGPVIKNTNIASYSTWRCSTYLRLSCTASWITGCQLCWSRWFNKHSSIEERVVHVHRPRKS